MCGIAGIINTNGKVIEKTEVQAMIQRLAHRGPDDQGIYIKENVGLGHSRLSIIDLTETGHQPMTNGDASLHIVFNGEIYNYKELKRDLQAQGARFRSTSDTEVVLRLYEKEELECVRKLRGMFAFAIWDEKKKRLFVARDRLGQKPLKYFWDGKHFLFASELKALLTHPCVPRIVDWGCIGHYLSLQYTPTPSTGLLHIKKLPPASTMVLENDKLTIDQYWKLDFRKKLSLTESEWQERIREKLDEAVRLQMRADVEVGAFLSGGVDSSTIVHFMAQQAAKPIHTFSVGFDEKEFNELPQAKLIAERYGTEHHELHVSTENLTELLPQLVSMYEEPYADSSAIPTSLISKATSEYVKVALSGDGGDENFAGYPRYNALARNIQFEWAPKTLRRISWKASRALAGSSTFLYRLERFLEAESLDKKYYKYFAYFTDEEKSSLFTHRFPSTAEHIAKMLHAHGWSSTPSLDTAFETDLQSYLLDDVLPKVDIASMQYGLETRSPFLDHHIIELAAQMPADLKLRGEKNKHILKEAMRGTIPNEILFGKKRGFSVPLLKWMKRDLNQYAKEVLHNGRLVSENHIKQKKLEELFKRLAKHNNLYDAYKVWTILVLELWLSSIQISQCR